MKKLAIIGGFIFLLGFIIFTSTLAVCGWDLTKISTAPINQEKQYSIENTNQTITLQDDNMPLIVGASSDDQIHFIYYENERQSYEFDGSTDLTIEKKTQFKWYNYFFNIDFQTPCFSILLPANFNGSLALKTSNGKITVNDVTVKQLKLTTNNGVVSLKNLLSSEDVEVKSSNGKIEISDIKSAGLTCSTSSGSVYLSNILAKEIHAFTSNGKVVTTNTQTSQGTELRTSNGRIEIQDLNAGGDISLTTDNSKITGNIVGDMSDYSIASKTSNGKNNLPENSVGGSKNLKATTSNGEIFIQFTN